MSAVSAPPLAPPALPRCLWAAWDTVRRDPVGVLLPASGLLLLQALAALAARITWESAGIGAAAGVFLAATAARSALGAPLRSRMIAAGAAAAGLPVAPWGRPLALLGVQLVTGPAHTAAFLIVAAPLVGGGAALGADGWWSSGSLLAAAGICGGTLASLGVRGLLAWAPIEAVVGGASGLGALRRSLVRGGRERGVAVLTVGAGDLLVALGGVACGALALPGYPIADLALLHRWSGPTRGGAR